MLLSKLGLRLLLVRWWHRRSVDVIAVFVLSSLQMIHGVLLSLVALFSANGCLPAGFFVLLAAFSSSGVIAIRLACCLSLAVASLAFVLCLLLMSRQSSSADVPGALAVSSSLFRPDRLLLQLLLLVKNFSLKLL